MADRRAGGTIPHVRTKEGGKAPRARNKNGQWRKKRSDTGGKHTTASKGTKKGTSFWGFWD